MIRIAMGAALGVAVVGAVAQAQPWAAVAAEVRRDAPEEALALLSDWPEEAQARPDARYLRGRLLEELGRLAEAGEAFSGISGLLAEVAADARWRRASALARGGRCEEAMPLLGAVRGPPRRAEVARALRAECAWRASSDGETRGQAIEALRDAIEENGAVVDTAALRFTLAEALDAIGDHEGARTELRTLFVERPGHPEADAFEARLAAYGPISLSEEEQLRRAEALLSLRRTEEAAVLLEGEPPAALRARWLHVRGMALYRQRSRYAEAAAVLARAAQLGGEHAIEDEFHAARARSRADEDAAAIAAYRRLMRAHPRHPRASEAEFLAAWLEIHLGRRSGERSMRRFLEGPRGRRDPHRRRRAVWHLAMTAYRRGRHAAAATLFERYAEPGTGPMVEGRGRYWLGHARQAQGRREAAREAYQAARRVDPLHWYGLLAGQRLEALGVREAPPFEESEAAPAPVPALSLPAEVRFYQRLGLLRDAREALRRREREVRRAAPAGRGTEALVRTYRDLGGERRAYRLGHAQRALLRQRPTGAARWAWQAAYPRPHLAAVRGAAERHGVPWEHVYATMRQESGYDPDAVSHADAIGLLQLLPRSGARVARRLGVPFRRDQLFDPRWNIRLGVAAMAGTLRRFGGCVPLATAAYNAGGARVRRWMEEQGDVDLDLFVEQIPFDETRNYVRRVSSHRARYAWLADPSAPLRLPGRVSEGGCI